MENENKNAPVDNQPVLTDTEKKLKADHDALYGKYSKKNAQLYKASELAFSANPETILSFDDEIKDKIVKEKFWVNTFTEALAVLWEDFYKKTKDDLSDKSDIEKTVAELVKDKKISEYRQKENAEETAIDLFIATNSSLFEWIEQPKELLKKEIKKLADWTPIQEKLEDASALVKIKYSKQVNFANSTSWNSKNFNTNWVTRNPALAKIFWNKI